jgi:hypothetical protein
MWTGRTPWHIDGQNPLACRRRQLQGCWRRILACRQTPSFWHIDDHSFGISTETVFFGMSTEAIFFTCGRRQSCLACRRGQPFWHVDGRFGMLTRRIPPSKTEEKDKQWRKEPDPGAECPSNPSLTVFVGFQQCSKAFLSEYWTGRPSAGKETVIRCDKILESNYFLHKTRKMPREGVAAFPYRIASGPFFSSLTSWCCTPSLRLMSPNMHPNRNKSPSSSEQKCVARHFSLNKHTSAPSFLLQKVETLWNIELRKLETYGNIEAQPRFSQLHITCPCANFQDGLWHNGIHLASPSQHSGTEFGKHRPKFTKFSKWKKLPLNL